MKILVTGATGMVGRELVLELARKGHQLWLCGRSEKKVRMICPVPHTHVHWPLSEDSDEELNKIDAVVNLVGENVAGSRWSSEVKSRIISSRVGAIEDLKKSFARCGYWPKVWVNASAVGFYGSCSEEIVDENSLGGEGFLAETCRDWERAFEEKSHDGEEGVRKAILRIGVVLGREGGALAKMLPLFQNGLGGRLGSGEQVMSWIHVEDLVGAAVHILEDENLTGVFNGVAPNAVSNKEFTEALASQLELPAPFPAPALALKLVLGEMAVVVLQGQKVEPKKLLSSGYTFKFDRLEKALANLLVEEKEGGHTLVVRQWSSRPLEEVFDFFSRAENLEKITPPFLQFKILKVSTPDVDEGTLIDYRLKLHGVPVGWRTRIDEWNSPTSFVDTQLKGPYKKWHHTHTFERVAGGTLITDHVRYKLRFGPLGRLLREAWVKKDIEKIFAYRLDRLEEIFS